MIYYVSTSGDDTNNGTTTSTPFRHHPWDTNASGVANSTTLAAGDSVLFNRDDIFYETEITAWADGSSGNEIVLGAYGTGDDPILSGGKLLDSGWALESGTIYSIDLTTECFLVYNESTKLTENAGNYATLTSGEWDWDTNKLYVNIGVAPTTIVASQIEKVIYPAGRDYLSFQDVIIEMSNYASTAASGIIYVVSGDHVVFDNVTIQKFLAYGIRLYISTNCTIKNSSLVSMADGKHAVYFSNGGSGAVVQDNVFTGAATKTCLYMGASGSVFGNTFNGGAYGISVSGVAADIYNNDINNSASYGIYLYNIPSETNIYSNNFDTCDIGIYASGVNSYINVYGNDFINDSTRDIFLNYVTTGSIYSNTSDGTIYSVTVNNCTGINIYKNTISNAWNGLKYSSGGHGHGISIGYDFDTCDIYDNKIDACYLGILISPAGSTVAGNGNCYHNLVTYSKVNSVGTMDAPTTHTGCINIINNTIIHSPIEDTTNSYPGHALTSQKSSGAGEINVVYENNLVVIDSAETGIDFVQMNMTAATGYDITLDYNNYYSATGGQWLFINATGSPCSSLSAWQILCGNDTSISGDEAHSIDSDPLLNSSYRLKKGSPCIDAGVVINGITDGYKGDAPDIGWKEYIKMVGGLSLGLNLQL